MLRRDIPQDTFNFPDLPADLLADLPADLLGRINHFFEATLGTFAASLLH